MSKTKTESQIVETVLELVHEGEGSFVLREATNPDEVLVSIQFSDKVTDILREDIRLVSEQMIGAALAAVVKQQMARWHAHIHDEEPKHYS